MTYTPESVERLWWSLVKIDHERSELTTGEYIKEVK